MALPSALWLLLLGFQAQGAHAWCSEKDKLYIDKPVSDPDIVKFAVSAFNSQNKDEYAYRTIHIMGFSKVQEKLPATFLVKLRLRRTICKTFEDSLDTCPFQDDPELEKFFIRCEIPHQVPLPRQPEEQSGFPVLWEVQGPPTSIQV